jgi:hypothetical protein
MYFFFQKLEIPNKIKIKIKISCLTSPCTSFFVGKNAAKLPDLDAKIPEIAIFTKKDSSRSPKYRRILKLFYFPLLQVAKFG